MAPSIRWGVVVAVALGAFLGLLLADVLADVLAQEAPLSQPGSGVAAPHKPCVSLRITNCYSRPIRIAHGPVDLCAEVRVPPNAANRWVEVVWDYAPQDIDTQITAGIMPGFDNGAGAAAEALLSGRDSVDAQDGSLGSSLRSLNGAAERLRHDIRMSHLSGGTYEIKAAVYTDTDRKQLCGTARTTVKVQ